jgi:hypothetical protein
LVHCAACSLCNADLSSCFSQQQQRQQSHMLEATAAGVAASPVQIPTPNKLAGILNGAAAEACPKHIAAAIKLGTSELTTRAHWQYLLSVFLVLFAPLSKRPCSCKIRAT